MASAGRALALVAVAATSGGCRVLVELVETDPDETAGVDARPIDPTCDEWPLAPAILDPCVLPAPGPALVLGDGLWVYDTNSGALTDPAQDVTFPVSALTMPAEGPEVRAMSIERFELVPASRLRVVGKRPLVLVVWSTARVAGTVDATSRIGAPSAGADPEACALAPPQIGTSDLEGSGGGGGGGLGASGASGGDGNDGLASGGAGGLAADPVVVRGGCAGAAGGNPLAGAGGPGGGAVYVAARDEVQVDGVIIAGGGGGGGAQGGRSGGGGGGAGGFIALHAPSIMIGAAAVLAANGGGGGGGSDGSPAIAGQAGQPGANVAAPGAGQGMGGAGGAGGAGSVAAADGVLARRGTGGGGGGVGWIVVEGPSITVVTGAVISPAAR